MSLRHMRACLRPVALVVASTLLGALAGRCLDRNLDALLLSAGIGGVAIGCLLRPRRLVHPLAASCILGYPAGMLLHVILDDVNCQVLPCVLVVVPMPFIMSMAAGYWWVRPALRR